MSGRRKAGRKGSGKNLCAMQPPLPRSLTFISVVGDGAEVEEVRPDDGVADGVALAKLDLDPLAQRREHLGEDDLEMSGCLKEYYRVPEG